MDDLISRQEAIDALEKWLDEWTHPNAQGAIMDCIQTLNGMPSAQPQRPKGKWIYGEHDVAMCDGYRCDQCGFFAPWDYQHKFIDFIKDYNFCPHCGADMR